MSQQQSTPSIDDVRAQVSQMLDSLDPETQISATVVFKVNKVQESAFKQNIAALASATRKMPGVSVFDYRKHKSFQPESGYADAVGYLIFEDWKSVKLFRAQWNSEHLKYFQSTVGDLVVAPPDLNFYTGTDYTSEDAQQAHVLRTGQKRCWDRNGNLIPPKNTGEDGEIRAGVASPSSRFIDNQNGTVTDNLTGLVWLKDANLFGEVSWTQALQNARNLASGATGLTDGSGAGEWRLPNINELQSLLDLDNSYGPALPADHPFMNLRASNYWSSTTVAIAPPLGWYVALAVGPPVFDLKFNSMRMWPVRSGDKPRIPRTGQKQCYDPLGNVVPCERTGQDGEIQAGLPFPNPRFHDNGDGTVTDNLTGLIWLKNANPFGPKSWHDALRACNSLTSGNADLSDSSVAGDWRLPNIFELRSVIDYSQFSPALTAGHPFINVRPSLYWSSTTVASAPNLARFCFVGIGPSVWDHKSVELCVWPVRGRK
jgi:quinol monooxygenase YgiN